MISFSFVINEKEINFFLVYAIINKRFVERICWEDESHAWTIARNTNLIQLIELMKVEGHFFNMVFVYNAFCKNESLVSLPNVFA